MLSPFSEPVSLQKVIRANNISVSVEDLTLDLRAKNDALRKELKVTIATMFSNLKCPTPDICALM